VRVPFELYALELYLLIVFLDVILAWVQPTTDVLPRRLTHLLTEPPQALVRRAVPTVAGWDLSPVVVIGLLGLLRLWWIQP
jgi:YggT family protein